MGGVGGYVGGLVAEAGVAEAGMREGGKGAVVDCRGHPEIHDDMHSK